MDVESGNNVISKVADDVKQKPEEVTGKIRPILPEEKATW